MNFPKNILCFLFYGLGNMVLFLPALKALRNHFPQAKIAVMVGPGAYELIKNYSFVDEVILYNLYSKKGYQAWLERFHFFVNLRKHKFDLTISTGQIITAWKTPILALLTGAKRRVGAKQEPFGFLYTDRVEINESKHWVERELDMMHAIGIEYFSGEKPVLDVQKEDINHAVSFLESNRVRTKDRVISICPGGYWGGSLKAKLKHWPISNYAILADTLIEEYGAKIMFLGSSSEEKAARRITDEMKNDAIIAVGKTTVGQAAALIKLSKLFISNDGGLMHVAAAVQTPGIAMFGPTDPNICGPYTDNYISLRGNVNCPPCFGKADCLDNICIRKISVEDVMRAVDEINWEDKNRRIVP